MEPSGNKQIELIGNENTNTIENDQKEINIAHSSNELIKSGIKTPKMDYNGSWWLRENRGHEEYLKAVGENFFIRKLFNTLSITCEISHTDAEYSMVTKISPKFTSPDVIKGKFGENVEVTNPRGEREVRRLEWVDGRIVAHSTLKDRGNQEERREWKLTDNDTVIEMTIDNLTHKVSYKQFYKKMTK